MILLSIGVGEPTEGWKVAGREGEGGRGWGKVCLAAKTGG